jgi:uncharacterized membrane protein YqjE
MAITATLARLGATVAAMLRTRLELASVEIEEQVQRWTRNLMLSLLLLFLGAMAIVFLALLVIIVFWDSHRIAAALGMTALFALAAGVVGIQLRARLRSSPRLLAATLAELHKDIDGMRQAEHAHES